MAYRFLRFNLSIKQQFFHQGKGIAHALHAFVPRVCRRVRHHSLAVGANDRRMYRPVFAIATPFHRLAHGFITSFHIATIDPLDQKV